MKTGILAAAAFCLTLFLVCCALPAGGTVTGKETRIELGRETNRILGPGAEESGRRIVISEGGSYRVTGSLTGGQLYVDAPGKEVVLILDGASIIKDGDAAIYVNRAAQTEIWLEEGTENLLQSREDPEKAPEENAEDAVIFSESSLTVEGTGALTVTGETGHGLQSRRSLFLTGGTITAETRKDGFKAEETLSVAGGSILARCGEKGFQTDESLEISGGTVRTETGDDAFHSNRYARISGGTLRIDTVEKGIHADQELTVDGGTVRVMDSVEGLEANQVRITGGELSIVASDDGINANGEPEGKGEKRVLPCLYISGGSIFIDADGDGVDSNGDLIFEGGTTVIFGPEDDLNGALDYGSENGGDCIVNGGTVLAAGSSGMAVTFSENSRQPSFLCFLDFVYGPGEEIRISDETGRLLFSGTAVKRGSSVVFTSPDLETGVSCLLEIGGRTREIAMRSNAVTER